MRRWAVARLRNASALIGLAALVGCGGSSNVSNPAHVRFFDALLDSGNVRLYIGGSLYSAGDDGPSYEHGDGFDYGDAPSGTGQSIVLNPYSNQNTTLASLTSQSLVRGAHYTLIASTTSSTSSGTTTNTPTLKLYRDILSGNGTSQYVRVLNAYAGATALYTRIVRKSDGTVVYGNSTNGTTTTGIVAGGTTGYLSITPTVTDDDEDYSLQVYDTSDFSNEIGSSTLSLKVGSPKTVVIYNKSDDDPGGDISIKSDTDTTDTAASG